MDLFTMVHDMETIGETLPHLPQLELDAGMPPQMGIHSGSVDMLITPAWM